MTAFRKSVFLVLSILLVISIFPVSAVEKEIAAEYYGEAYLELKTDEQRIAYRLLEEGIAGLSPMITFEGIVEIKYGQIPDVLRAVCVDHPQYFWFLEVGKCNYNQLDYGNLSPVISFEPTYILDGKVVSAGSQELSDAMFEFHSQVRKIINEIPVNYVSEYEIALYLHDYLAENVTYTLEGEHPSAYAALVQGRAACYGYSKAYQCLLNAAGIRARTITGTCPDENGRSVGHAWNQVWLDGECCYVDVTWDDLDEITIHSYFGCSLEQIASDHFADEDFYLPECGHNDLRVYSGKAIEGVARWDQRTIPTVAASSFRVEKLQGRNARFSCEVEFAGNAFLAWFDTNGYDILSLLGVSESVNVYYYDFGNVFHLIVEDFNYETPIPLINQITLEIDTVSLMGAGTRYQLQPQIVTSSPLSPIPIYKSADESIATVDKHGVVTAVAEGETVVTVSNTDGSVSASCVIQVDGAPEHTHNMRYFERAEPTCTQDGHEPYYLCTDCGCRFADVMGAVQHTKTAVYMIPASHSKLFYKNLGQYHVQRCKCGEELAETKQLHTDSDHNGTCDLCNLPCDYSDPISPTVPDRNELIGKEDNGALFIVLIVSGIVAAVVTFLLLKRKIRGY